MNVTTPHDWQLARLHDPENPIAIAAQGQAGYQRFRRTYCEVCLIRGIRETRSLEVHHIIPRNVFESADMPDLETDPRNLVTLCDIPGHPFQCHKSLGHLGNYQRENVYLFEALHDAWDGTRKPKQEDGK